MRRTLPTLLAAVALTAAASGCQGSRETSDADVANKVADQLVEGGLDRDTADCFGKVIVDEIGADEVKDIDFSAEEPPKALQEDLAAAALKAVDTCDIDLGALEG